MSNCSHLESWIPPERCMQCGHRISFDPHYLPVETRVLPWYCKITEHALRWLARKMLTADITARTQVERKPDHATSEEGSAGTDSTDT